VSGSAVPILMYHEVAGPADTASWLAVPPAAFAAQLAQLQAAGRTTITLSALAAGLAGQAELPARPVVLTFDDGYADFHQTALPLLLAHGFTATVFVTTGWLADAGPALRPRPGPMLCWPQVREVAAAGIEIGAHSHTHRELDQLRAGQLEHELRDSKSLLEDRLGGNVPALAYPFGYSSPYVRQAARAAGYAHACAVGNLLASQASDPFALPRLTVRHSTGQATFQQLAQGQRVPLIYAKDRALTRGYAVVRRSRAVLHGAARGQLPAIRP
jgi:peptidoglycan/xylan/chitin deacetylase (PgdA/CDA1 family)